MKTLFLDRSAIQRLDRVWRVLHSPVKHPTAVLAPCQPWETGWVEVDRPPLWDEPRGVWRMVYSGVDGLRPMLAESHDGIEWRRPVLGRVRTPDGSDTNLIDAHDNPGCTAAAGSLFAEDFVTGDSEFRYKGLVMSRDLRCWDRLERQAFLPLSPLDNSGLFDYGGIYACPPVRMGDELFFYHTGHRFSHLNLETLGEHPPQPCSTGPASAVFLARMRVDGFSLWFE